MAGKLYGNLGVWVGWGVILYCDMAFGCVVGWRNCIVGHQIVLQHGAVGCRVSVSQYTKCIVTGAGAGCWKDCVAIQSVVL